MLFHKFKDQENIPSKLSSLQLKGNIIESENSLKFFGVILDEHLTWKKHIQLIEDKVSKNVGVLYKTSKLILMLTLNVYEAWASTNKIKLKKLFGNMPVHYLTL